jgi:hypothetical protein
MRREKLILLAFAGILGVPLAPLTACAGPANTVAAFKLEGDTLKRTIDPGPNAIVANQHYVSIAVEEVRIHRGNMPRPLALVLKVLGALPQGGEFTAILGTARVPEGDGFYKFDRPAIVSPFVYKGQPLVVEISLAPCTEDWAKKIDEAKRVWGDTRHLDPNAFEQHPVDTTHLGSDGSDSFRAGFATTQDPAALPLTAGKYVIVSHPNPSELAEKVTLDPRGYLVWKSNGEQVQGASFATIFVNRRKRGPRRMDTPLERAKRTVDGAITAERFDDARSALQQLPDLIEKDPSITIPEKELEKARLKIFQLRIERRLAKQQKDKDTFVAKTDEIVKELNEIRKKFDDMLEPFEKNQMQYSIRRFLRERDLL